MKVGMGAGLKGVIAGGTLAAAVMVGCGREGASVGVPEATGAVTMALQLTDTVAIDRVDYVLTSFPSKTYQRSGSIVVSDPGATVTAFVDGLPAGGYELQVSATSTDGQYSCRLGLEAPTQHFPGRLAVTAGQTTSFDFVLSCSPATPGTGAVDLNGEVDVCPELTAVDVAPLSASIGGTIAVHAEASDPDPGAALSYVWTATVDGAPTDAGQFAATNSPATTFTCLQAASIALEVRVSDRHCAASSRAMVSCLPSSDGGAP